jgi:hypothetical protein
LPEADGAIFSAAGEGFANAPRLCRSWPVCASKRYTVGKTIFNMNPAMAIEHFKNQYEPVKNSREANGPVRVIAHFSLPSATHLPIQSPPMIRLGPNLEN